MLRSEKKWRKNDTNKKGKGDMSRAMKSIINARAARRRVVVVAAVAALVLFMVTITVSLMARRGGDQKAMRTEVVSTPSKGEDAIAHGKADAESNLTRDKEEEEEEEEEDETRDDNESTEDEEIDPSRREDEAPPPPPPPPPPPKVLRRRFVGDIKLHSSLVSLVEARATPRKKQLVLTTFDHRSYVFALHHALNVERVLRESEFSEDDDNSSNEEEDIGGWVALTYDEATCVKFERLWKLAHEHNYHHNEHGEQEKDRTMLKTEIGCVWDSRFSGPDGTVWTALNDIHERLVTAVTQFGHLLWMARWDLMARIALRGVQVIGSDTDVVYTTNPFPFLTEGALGKYTVMIAEEIHESGHAQCGLSFLNGQKMRADGPSVKLITDVPLILRRIIDTAKDFPDFRRNYVYRKITRERDIGHGVTIFFDQHLFKDSIITHARGHRSFAFFFGDGINNWGDTKEYIDAGLEREHEYRHGTGGYKWKREVMNEASGYDEMQLERFGIYSNDTRNHHILWTPLTNKPLSKESSEAFNSSGEGPDDFKKMVSYLKSWKEKKERNELTQDDEKRKAENAIGALERLTVGATDEEIAKGPFFGDKGYNPLPPMENFVPNGNLLARSYVLELEREIRESPLPKWHPKGRQPSNEEEQRSAKTEEEEEHELFAFLPQWLVQTWRVGTLGAFLDPSRLQDAKKDARAVAFHATNAWDKVGTLKSVGLWDERVDIALGANTARHKLADRQRVKAVAYLPEIDSQPQTFLQFDVKEDFILAGFYGLAMVAKKSGREMVVPRPPCASKWIRYFTDQNRWLEKPYKYTKCTHPFCDEWKIVPVLRKSFNERDSEHEETDLSKKYRCEIQGESIINEDPDPNKNRRLAWGKMCKHNHDNPKGLSPSDLDFYMKIFPDVKPNGGSKSFELQIPSSAVKDEKTGIYSLTARELSDMIRTADENADVWYLSKPIAPDFTRNATTVEETDANTMMRFEALHYCIS